MEELPTILETAELTSLLAGRIRKNYRHVRKWAKRTETNAFRVYDWEIGSYPLAIDFYAGRFCVQYFSRDRDNPEPSLELEQEVEGTLEKLFGISQKVFTGAAASSGPSTSSMKRQGGGRVFPCFGVWGQILDQSHRLSGYRTLPRSSRDEEVHCLRCQRETAAQSFCLHLLI